MGILSMYGSNGPIQQRSSLDWTYPTGEGSQTVYKGVYAHVKAAYDNYKNITGLVPNIDSLQLAYERGMGTLTVATVQDGPIQYELLTNEVTFPIETHPCFVTDAPVMTKNEMLAVQTAMAMGLERNPPLYPETPPRAYPFDGSAFSEKQDLLHSFYIQGVDTFYRSAYVLRSTQVCSKRSQVTASYTNVNKVETPPNTSQVNTIIGELPSGEWLKKAPAIRMYGNKKWQISQEWWWAPKWSKLLYDGKGTP